MAQPSITPASYLWIYFIIHMASGEASTIEVEKSAAAKKKKSQGFLCRHWCFTQFNLSTDKPPIPNHVAFGYLIYQEEVCPTTSKHHYQGYLECIKPKRITSLFKFIGLAGAHFEPRSKFSTSSEAAVYCRKPESRVEGGVSEEFGTISVDGVSRAYSEFISALQAGIDVTDPASPYLGEYLRHRASTDIVLTRMRTASALLNLCVDDIVLRPWQSDIVLYLTPPAKPDSRKIYWFWDPVGGVGKSTFTKYLMKHHGALSLNTTSCHRALSTFDACLKPPGMVIFDIDRDCGFQDRVNYSTLEVFKNGFGSIELYNPRQVILPPLHVIVFSNFLPRSTGLSVDRLVCRNLRETFVSVTGIPVHPIFNRCESPLLPGIPYHVSVESVDTCESLLI